jgi:tripartite-type tricarboxylate transporter receptor subunit TctC
MSDAGLKGYEVVSWYGLLAPAGTPGEVVQRLNAEVNRATQEPDAIERLASFGAEAVQATSAEFGEFIRNEIAKWAKVTKAAGLRAD